MTTQPQTQRRRRRRCVVALLIVAAVVGVNISRSTSDQTVIAQTPNGDLDRVVQTSGDITLLATPPSSVELDALTSDDELFVFAEQQAVQLTERVAVDLMEPGDYFAPDTPDNERTYDNLPSGHLPAGTIVDSFYFHADNETYEFRPRQYFGCDGQIGVDGSITFDRPIIGVVLRSVKLNRSNDDVGIDGVDYDEHTYRHFPGVNIVDGCASDRISISDDRHTLTVTNFGDIHHDNYRVLLSTP